MTFSPDLFSTPAVAPPVAESFQPIAALLRLICRPQQWWLLEQEPRVWQLPASSLLHWALMGRDSSQQYQLQSLQQLLQWAAAGQLVAPPTLTDLPGWPLLWRHWLAQGSAAGWLEARPLKGYWSLWQLLAPDATPLLQALGFSAQVPALSNTSWASVFLLSNGYQHYLLDCVAGVYQAANQRFCCLFKLCLRLPELAMALAKEAQTLQMLDVLFFQMVSSEQAAFSSNEPFPPSTGGGSVLPRPRQVVKAGLATADLPLSYQQISALAASKPWLLRYLPLSPAMSMYRLALCRYMPWLYRQLWPSHSTFRLLEQWIWQHRLGRPFIKAEFFEAALLAAVADGLPLHTAQQRGLYFDQQHEVRSALSLFAAQRNSAAADKSFMLADLPALTQAWLQQTAVMAAGQALASKRAKSRRLKAGVTTSELITGAKQPPLPPLLEQLKVLFLMLQSLRSPQLRQLIAQCPWLLLLLPTARQQRFIDSALSTAPALAGVLLEQLNPTQRLQAFKRAPQLITQAGISLTGREYKQLVALHPGLAVHFPAFATTEQLVRAVAEQPELFARLRPEQQTQRLLEQLLSLRGELLGELPPRQRSFKLCHLAISQHLGALAYVPDDFDRRLCQQEHYWEFYQESYQWALQHQPQLVMLMQQRLPEFYLQFIEPLIGSVGS